MHNDKISVPVTAAPSHTTAPHQMNMNIKNEQIKQLNRLHAQSICYFILLHIPLVEIHTHKYAPLNMIYIYDNYNA